jgi:hypothetical protein
MDPTGMDGFHKYCTELPGAYCAPHQAAYKNLVSSSRYTWKIVFMALRKVHIITDQYPNNIQQTTLFELHNLSSGLGNYIRLVTDGQTGRYDLQHIWGRISNVKLY